MPDLRTNHFQRDTEMTMTTTGRGKDVAWGFFYTSETTGRRHLCSAGTRGEAKEHRACLSAIAATPIFKITEPRTEIRAGRGGRKK